MFAVGCIAHSVCGVGRGGQVAEAREGILSRVPSAPKGQDLIDALVHYLSVVKNRQGLCDEGVLRRELAREDLEPVPETIRGIIPVQDGGRLDLEEFKERLREVLGAMEREDQLVGQIGWNLESTDQHPLQIQRVGSRRIPTRPEGGAKDDFAQKPWGDRRNEPGWGLPGGERSFDKNLFTPLRTKVARALAAEFLKVRTPRGGDAPQSRLAPRIVRCSGRYWVLVVRDDGIAFEPLAGAPDGIPPLWDGGGRRPSAVEFSADGRLAAVQVGTKIQLGWVRRGTDDVEIGSRAELELPPHLEGALLAALRPLPHAVVLTVLSVNGTFCVVADADLRGVVAVERVLPRPLRAAVHLPSGIIGLDARGRCVRATGGAGAPLRNLVDLQQIDAVDTPAGSTVVAWARDEGWCADWVGSRWEESVLPLDGGNASATWSLTRAFDGGAAEAVVVLGSQVHVREW